MSQLKNLHSVSVPDDIQDRCLTPVLSGEGGAGEAGNALLQTDKFFEYHCTVRCLS